MPINSSISLRGSISGLDAGSRTISPIDLTNSDAPAQVIQISLLIGANLISVPSNAKGCLVVFDPTSIIDKVIKGHPVIDEQGITVDKDGWFLLTFNSPPISNFYIACTEDDTGKYTEITFF